MNRTASTFKTTHRHWLVVSAWRPELAYFRRNLRLLEKQTLLQFTLAEVGIGLVASAIGTTRAIAASRPEGVLLIGTAGLYPTVKVQPALGQAAIIHQICLLPDLSNGTHAFLPARMNRACIVPKRHIEPFARAASIPILNVACPVGITHSAEAARAIARESGADLENLEAYAVYQAARAASLPFIALLGISNQVGPKGHRQWLNYRKQAAATACKAAIAGFRRLATTVPSR
jgi:nucleoside phosphorylase